MRKSPVEAILHKMKMLFGSQFDELWRGVDYAEMVTFWEQKLRGFSREELIRGYNALDTQKRPPNVPVFLKLCRPDVNFESAYFEAVKGISDRRVGKVGEWSHPAIFWAAASMTHDLLNMSHGQVKPRFDAKLEKELQKGQWEPIPEAMQPLPPPVVDRQKSRQKAEKALSHIKSFINQAVQGVN